MKSCDVSDAQRTAARMVGWSYLLAIPLAIFSEFYVSGRLVVRDDVQATARNILAHEGMFRVGIASNLMVFAIDVVLIVGLYGALSPVNSTLARVAAAWRLVETALLVAVITTNDSTVLRLLARPDYLRVFDDAQLQGLSRLAIADHGAGYNVGLMFAGCGSTLFCWLWYQSGYVPKLLATWGILASLVLASCTLAFIVYPGFTRVATIAVYGGPIFLFELTMGLWLVLRRLEPDARRANR
ncbi:MAG: hypothetical protein JWM95_1490 [Gemmatimonadetes bacterium]|nr:hypothetical protein [Gemmatimonadota bacterium]